MTTVGHHEGAYEGMYKEGVKSRQREYRCEIDGIFDTDCWASVDGYQIIRLQVTSK